MQSHKFRDSKTVYARLLAKWHDKMAPTHNTIFNIRVIFRIYLHQYYIISKPIHYSEHLSYVVCGQAVQANFHFFKNINIQSSGLIFILKNQEYFRVFSLFSHKNASYFVLLRNRLTPLLYLPYCSIVLSQQRNALCC